MNFATKLRNLRVARNMTQMDLARDLQTSQSAITMWETGRREPDFRTIQKISAYFRVPMSELIPSEEITDQDSVNVIAQSMQSNPKLRILFDRSKYLCDSDVDAILAVISAIQKERINE